MLKVLCAVVFLLCFTGKVRSVAVSEACPGGSADCTDAGTFCENSVCKYKEGENCSASTDHCLTGATCTAASVCTCGDNHTPSTDKMMCLAKVDQSCTQTSECAMGAECTGQPGSMTCTCADNKVPKADNTACLLKIGENCSAAGSMCVMGANCNQTCMCPANSEANTAKDKCLMFNGGTCTESTDCIQDANFECKDRKCACKDKYLVTDDMKMCKLKAGEACANTPDCGMNAECAESKCTCMANYVDESGRCGVKVGGNCTGNAHCVMNAECRDNKCSCKADYTTDGDLCKSGSAALIGSLVLMMAAFVTSRLL